MNDRVPERDLSRLTIPRWGRLVETGDRYEPYRLVDADGAAVAPVAVFLQELLAAGKAAATVRSYGMDLLRWWRCLHAVEVPWDRATRVDARDFSYWIQLTVKPRATAAERRPARSVGAPNPVTGKLETAPQTTSPVHGRQPPQARLAVPHRIRREVHNPIHLLRGERGGNRGGESAALDAAHRVAEDQPLGFERAEQRSQALAS
jgi:hypothetical protein